MKISTKQLTQTALLTALVFVVTRFIQIPIPLGYFNVGNVIILFGCLFLSSPFGIIAGGLGSALADLVSYPVYTIPTFIIKTIMPYIFYKLQNKPMIAFAISTLIPLFGYTITGMLIYKNFGIGLSQFPGLLIEYIANCILFHILFITKKNVN